MKNLYHSQDYNDFNNTGFDSVKCCFKHAGLSTENQSFLKMLKIGYQKITMFILKLTWFNFFIREERNLISNDRF